LPKDGERSLDPIAILDRVTAIQSDETRKAAAWFSVRNRNGPRKASLTLLPRQQWKTAGMPLAPCEGFSIILALFMLE
jgi:hypothetical protein